MSNNLSPDQYISHIKKQQGYMPIHKHLEILRWHIIRSCIYLLVFSIIIYYCFNLSWVFVMKPILSLIHEAEAKDITVKLISTQLFHNFFIRIKISLLLAFIFSIPLILWEVWRFLLPSMQKKSQAIIYTVLFFSVLLFWFGIIFSRFWIWPLINNFFIYEWMLPETIIENSIVKPEIHLTINDYLSFFFSFHFALGMIFQMPVISILLSFLNILKWQFFIRFWKEAAMIILITSAIITPPDILSMAFLSFPMFILYIISALSTYFINLFKKTHPCDRPN